MLSLMHRVHSPPQKEKKEEMERKRAANHSVLNRHLALFQVLFTDILLVLIILQFTDEETKTQRNDRPAAGK